MKKAKVLLIEDNHEEFRIISSTLNGKSFEVYPKIGPRDNFDPIIKLLQLSSLYVLNKKTEPERKKELETYIIETMKKQTPDILIIDISLRNQGYSTKDMDGGVIRKDVLTDLYPETKCIFLSGWEIQTVSPFMLHGDEYVWKYKNGAKNFKYIVEGDLIYHLKKVLKLL
jgi:hypothetical protein